MSEQATEQAEMEDAPRCPDCGWNNGEHSVACGSPTLPHGTQPTERQWQTAEALDALVTAQGVVLDDDRLDWLVEWVAARESAVLRDAVALLRRFPTTEGQRLGMAAAIVLVESLVPRDA